MEKGNNLKALVYVVTVNVPRALSGAAALAALSEIWKELRHTASTNEWKRWISWAKFKTEAGEQTGHLHIQGVCKVKCDMDTLKRLLPSNAHLEAKGSYQEEKEAVDYVDSSDEENIRFWAHTHVPPATLVQGDVPITYKAKDVLQYDKMYPWQKELIHELEQPVDRRKIIWYVDEEGGNGKSSLLKYLIHNSSIAWSAGAGSLNDIAFASSSNIDSTRAFIVDYPRHTDVEEEVNYDALEKFKDGIMSINKYKSTNKTFAPKHVVVFSNNRPDESKMSSDRWDVRVLRSKRIFSSHVVKTPIKKRKSQEEESPVKRRFAGSPRHRYLDDSPSKKVTKVSDFSDDGFPSYDQKKDAFDSESTGETLGSQDTASGLSGISDTVIRQYLEDKKKNKK